MQKMTFTCDVCNEEKTRDTVIRRMENKTIHLFLSYNDVKAEEGASEHFYWTKELCDKCQGKAKSELKNFLAGNKYFR